MERNPVGWFEIPVTDMERAKAFYENLFKVTLEKLEMPNAEMWMFAHGDIKGAGGALIKHEQYEPRDNGVLIYFTSITGNLTKEGQWVKENGGKVLVPTTNIAEHGYITVILDSEGNRIALHTMELKEE